MPRFSERKGDHRLVLSQMVNELPLHDARAPGIHRLGSIGTVVGIREWRRPPAKRRNALSRSDVVERDLECRRFGVS
jgi:hypothetical protein